MERSSDRSAGSTYHPPFFDDNANYAAWKAKMKAFLWAQDVSIWSIVESGWEYPTKLVKTIESTSTAEAKVHKPMSEWTADEKIKSTNNQRALNSFYTALSSEKFQLISHCESAKQVWEVLEITHEGTSTVKESKLQQLMQSFENMKMTDDELFDDFYAKLIVVVNGCFNLGDPIPEHRIVKKILRSLPMKYHSKKTAIEESKDLSVYKLDELIGNLTTYEMDFPDKEKSKRFAFKASNFVEDETSSDDADHDDILSRKIRKFLKNKGDKGCESRSSSNYENTNLQEHSSEQAARFRKILQKKRNKAKVKCFACGGNGHIASECANTLKKLRNDRDKAKNAQSSDSESGDDFSTDCESEVVALVGLVATSDESDDEDPDLEEVVQQYIKLSENSKDLKRKNQVLKDQVEFLKKELSRSETGFQSQLEASENSRVSLLEKIEFMEEKCREQADIVESVNAEKANLVNELELLKNKAGSMITSEKKLNNLLTMGRSFGDKRGLGYIGENAFKGEQVTKFMKDSAQPNSEFIHPISTEFKPRLKKFVPVCHFCGTLGHIKPTCNKFRQAIVNSKRRSVKQRFEKHTKETSQISKLVPGLKCKVKKLWRRKEPHCGRNRRMEPRYIQLRVNSRNFKEAFMNKEKELLEENLKIHLKEIKRISKLISLPLSPFSKMKQVWRRIEPHEPKPPHTDSIDV